MKKRKEAVMILEQVPSRSKRHFSRNHFSDFTLKPAASISDDWPPHLTHPHSKLLFINKALNKFCDHQLLGTPYVQEYLLALYRRNRSINTIRTYFIAIFQFLKFLKTRGCQRFEMISCEDLSSFIEHLQDLGLKPTTVFSRLLSLKAFFYYHIDAGSIDPAVLMRITSASRSLWVSSNNGRNTFSCSQSEASGADAMAGRSCGGPTGEKLPSICGSRSLGWSFCVNSIAKRRSWMIFPRPSTTRAR